MLRYIEAYREQPELTDEVELAKTLARRVLARVPWDDATAEITELLTTARKRILRHLGKHGLLNDDHGDLDPLSDEAPMLANCYATSIARRQTLGSRPGAPLDRIGRDPHAQWQERVGELQAHIEGLS